MARTPADAYVKVVRLDAAGVVVESTFWATYRVAGSVGSPAETTEQITQQAYSHARARRPAACAVQVMVPASVHVAQVPE